MFALDSLDGRQLTFDAVDFETAVVDAASGGLLRLMATIETSKRDNAAPAITPPASMAGESKREIGWADGKRMTAVYSYAELAMGERIDYPALVETAETTCVIPQRWRAETDSYGALKVWSE